MTWKILVCLLLLSGCTQWPESVDKDLSSYPFHFFDERLFDANIIVDKDADQRDIDSAMELIVSLRKLDSTIGDEIKRYPTFSDLSENAILIGSCSQEPHNKFVNIYVDCLSMKPKQAIIRIIDHNGSWLLFIVGFDEEHTNHAIQVLKDYHKYDLDGQDVEVVPTDDGYRIGEPT